MIINRWTMFFATLTLFATTHALTEKEWRFFFAAKHGNTDLIRELFHAGININAQASNGETALHIAATYDQTGCLRALINLGIEKQTQDKSGRTALHIATFYGHVSSVEELINAGINVKIEMDTGQTALHFAAAKGHLSCLKKIITADNDVIIKRGGPLYILPQKAVMYHVFNNSLKPVQILMHKIKMG